MGKLLVIMGLVAVSWLGGCQNSPMRIASMSPEELQSVNTEMLCMVYGGFPGWPMNSWKNSAKIRAELDRREFFSEEEWKIIDERGLELGARKEVYLAMYGDLVGCHIIISNGISWETCRSGHLYYSFENGRLASVSN